MLTQIHVDMKEGARLKLMLIRFTSQRITPAELSQLRQQRPPLLGRAVLPPRDWIWVPPLQVVCGEPDCGERAQD